MLKFRLFEIKLMMLLILGILFTCGPSVALDDDKNIDQIVKDRKLTIRSLPGYYGGRRNLYEVIGLKAMVEIKALTEDGAPTDGPRGILTLEQVPNGVRIYGTISGLTKGLHAFIVHEKGDLTKGCGSAGPHFNPYLVNHGAPNDPLRHVGDLGNIEAGEDGIAHVDGVDNYLTLTGVRGAIGRAIVVHEKQDDLGRGGSEASAKTGSAGARLACGVVAFI